MLHDAISVRANREVTHIVTYRGSHPFDMAFTLGRGEDDTVFYGDTWKNPDEFTGLATFYNTLDPKSAQNAINVIDGGGRNNLSSVYLICWSRQTVYMALNDAGEKAIIPEDWRYIVRICNVDENTDLITALGHALLRTPSLRGAVLYMNDDCWKKTGLASEFRNVPIRVAKELRTDEARVI